MALMHETLFSLLGEQPGSVFLFPSLPCVARVSRSRLFAAFAGQMPGPASMIPGQPMPGRMMPSVSANIHPAGGGPPPPGMSPMSGNLIGPRVPLAAPNGMCKWISSRKCFEYTWCGFSLACLVAGEVIVVETPLSAAGIIGSVHVGSQRLVPEVCLKL